ncbi:hypothetical protein OH76DRAFT_1241296 [Lentinus brumalis]|uniref:Uncharacterized protein n=1 Tax=Lentinus brumalis TaxID=2498619 RepID=A0A371CS61_9APHY|nr:hypothetical protein OH76DRAFT_1241296 [Polyporus brumalis]
MKSLVDLRLDVVLSILIPFMFDPPLNEPVPWQWRSRILTEFNSLRTLRLNFAARSLSAPASLQIAAYNDIIHANAELILCAPPHLPSIILTFLHDDSWDAESTNLIRGLPAWSRLDEALLHLRYLKSIVCMISMDADDDDPAEADLLRVLPDTSSPSYRRVTMSESREDGDYATIFASGLPKACSAGLVWITIMS